jgi:hypothetical protein
VSKVIEFKLKKPIEEASIKELDEALNQLELVELRVKELKNQLMRQWISKQKKG